MLKHGEPDTVCREQPAHGHTETAVANDDGRGLAHFDLIILRLLGRGLKPVRDELVVGNKEQRRQRHGDRHNRNQFVSEFLGQHHVLGGERKQDKGKLTALRKATGKHQRTVHLHAKHPPQQVEHKQLDEDEPNHQTGDQQWIGRNQRKVDTGPHRHEKQAQQQALEGLDVHLQLNPVLAVCQHHPGNEGT